MLLTEYAKKLLHWLHRFARRLKAWRPLFYGLIAVSSLSTAYGLFNTETYPSVPLQSGLSGVLWSLMVLATIELFQSLPEPLSSQQGFFLRLKLRFVWAFYYGLALVIVISTIILLATSVRLLRL